MDAVRLNSGGVEALADTVCGARHRAMGTVGVIAGAIRRANVKVQRPRVRDHAGKEVGLESWQVLRDGNLLLEWALNLMVLSVDPQVPPRGPSALGRPGESA